MIVIAVSNQKGGVGKTTTVVNVAAFAALAGRRTLVVDCDPQANATSVLLPAGTTAEGSVFTGVQPQEIGERLWLVPSEGADLLDTEKRLVVSEGGRFVLKQRLAAWQDRFDLVLLDCPPSLTLLPMNALNAATHLLIPIQTEYFAMEGLSQLLTAMAEIREESNPDLRLAGILLTMDDARLPFCRQVAQEIRRHFTTQVFSTSIPRDVALAAAPSHGRTIAAYDPLSPGGLAYLGLTRELLHGLR